MTDFNKEPSQVTSGYELRLTVIVQSNVAEKQHINCLTIFLNLYFCSAPIAQVIMKEVSVFNFEGTSGLVQKTKTYLPSVGRCFSQHKWVDNSQMSTIIALLFTLHTSFKFVLK